MRIKKVLFAIKCYYFLFLLSIQHINTNAAHSQMYFNPF